MSQLPSEAEGACPADPADESLAKTFTGLATAFVGLIGDTLHLAALETRLAALSLTSMLLLAVGAALLLVTAWLLLTAALAIWLAHRGLGWEVALIGVAALNGLLSIAAWYLIRYLSRNLLFPATRRTLVASGHTPGESPAVSQTDTAANRDS